MTSFIFNIYQEIIYVRITYKCLKELSKSIKTVEQLVQLAKIGIKHAIKENDENAKNRFIIVIKQRMLDLDYQYKRIMADVSKEQSVFTYVCLIDDVGVLLAVYNELAKFFVPKVIEKAKVKLQESNYTKIDFELKEIFYLMLLSSVITFVINMA